MTPGKEPLPVILDAAASSRTRRLFGLTNEQLSEVATELGAPAYRARQLSDALYRNLRTSLDQASNLPAAFLESLASAGYVVGAPKIEQVFTSVDGTERYLVAGDDDQTVETVWMPEGDDGESGDGSEAGDEETDQTETLTTGSPSPRSPETSDSATAPTASARRSFRRATICVSSQVGCAVGCRFCLTAKLGLQRNLSAGEIAGQVTAVLRRHQVRIGRERINLVFMGMGEPFLNYDNFMAAVRLLVDQIGIPANRMTVSTSGIVPGIERLAAEAVRPKLAISLNASNNAVREEIMPITRKWSIDDLLRAVRQVPLRAKERITFEYVLLGGVNDREPHADEIVSLVRRANLPAKVNLIVWNPGPGVPYSMPEPETVARFQQRLIARGVPAFLRKPRGRDIYAACGQLKRTVA